MAWEVCGVIITVKAVALSCSALAAIGVVAYGIYKYRQSLNKAHTYKKCESNSNDISVLVTVEDIKPKTVDSELRRRNVTKENIQNKANEDKALAKGDIQKQDICDEPQKKIELCDTGVQTVSDQVILPTNGNRSLNDDTVSVSSSTTLGGSESVCDSLASTETMTSDIGLDLLAAEIPTWSEMSDADRELCLCPSCEEQVSTIAIPCEHPYTCDECAAVLIKFYKKCPHCQKRITGFENIEIV